MKTNKIIEFTGLPNSGKTTLIRRLKEELPKKYGITVQVQREDAEIVPSEIPKKTWDRNVWITFGQLQSIVQAYHSNADIVLLDRGMFDAMFWSKFLLSENTANYEQSRALQDILILMNKKLEFHPDYLFLINVSVQESICRRAQIEGPSVYSKPDFLNNYQEKFFEVFKSYIEGSGKKNSPIPSFYYDTTNMSTNEVFEKVEKQIIKICNL